MSVISASRRTAHTGVPARRPRGPFTSPAPAVTITHHHHPPPPTPQPHHRAHPPPATTRHACAPQTTTTAHRGEHLSADAAYSLELVVVVGIDGLQLWRGRASRRWRPLRCGTSGTSGARCWRLIWSCACSTRRRRALWCSACTCRRWPLRRGTSSASGGRIIWRGADTDRRRLWRSTCCCRRPLWCRAGCSCRWRPLWRRASRGRPLWRRRTRGRSRWSLWCRRARCRSRWTRTRCKNSKLPSCPLSLLTSLTYTRVRVCAIAVWRRRPRARRRGSLWCRRPCARSWWSLWCCTSGGSLWRSRPCARIGRRSLWCCTSRACPRRWDVWRAGRRQHSPRLPRRRGSGCARNANPSQYDIRAVAKRYSGVPLKAGAHHQ